MTAPKDRDIEKRLRELEEEILQPQRIPRSTRSGQSARSLWMDVQNWYGDLSAGGKLVTVAIAIVLGSALFSAVLRLLGLAVQLAIVGAILYAIYRLVLRSPSRR